MLPTSVIVGLVLAGLAAMANILFSIVEDHSPSLVVNGITLGIVITILFMNAPK